jgi:5-formyltetrahydrofolate cyclo-ligase
MTEKSALRRELLALRNAVPAGERQARDTAINRAVEGHAWFRRARVVLGFYPIGSEPNLRLALAEALRLGKTVALPRCVPATGELRFHAVESLEGLLPGAHGIPAPPQGAPPCRPPPGSCLLLVPGIAFDRAGCRLGYGKGYYDRFLSRFQGHSLGICCDALLCGALPREPHDRAVESVITEKGAYYEQRRPNGEKAL